MAVKTANNYGKITISDQAIANVAGFFALDCYGVVDLAPKNLSDSVSELFKKGAYSKGVRVSTFENRIFLELNVIIKYGVSYKAVEESLKKSVKYSVEDFTGMIVESIKVNPKGVRI